MSNHCLRCKKECEEYWFTFGLPGAYCAECVEFVVTEHVYLSDLIDKVLVNLKQEFIKQRASHE